MTTTLPKLKDLAVVFALLLLISLCYAVFPTPAAHAKSAEYKASTPSSASIATFAGGCFWCTESDFEKLPGVSKVVSGYIHGHVKNPTYKEVSSGKTGHVEAVQVYFDPNLISYSQLLDHFWRHVDPTDEGGQFVDRGFQYSSFIFFHSPDQEQAAQKSKANLIKQGPFKKPIVTPIVAATKFYPAEDYHQDYYKRNPLRYKYYRFNSGRDQFLENAWKSFPNSIKFAQETPKKDTPKETGQPIPEQHNYSKPSIDNLKEKLTPLQFNVTQNEGTEPPFDNAYWNEKREGIYVDIVSGEPLFSSLDKYKSGSGWPSFSRALVKENVVEKKDFKLFLPRTEVRSYYGDSHLGHVFKDGPKPTGLRYCINSAALKFIPKEALAEQGYGQYETLFK